jgi:hypothetical protein
LPDSFPAAIIKKKQSKRKQTKKAKKKTASKKTTKDKKKYRNEGRSVPQFLHLTVSASQRDFYFFPFAFIFFLSLFLIRTCDQQRLRRASHSYLTLHYCLVVLI